MKRAAVTALATAVVTATLGVACAIDAEQVRKVTYPTTFQYIDEDRLHDAMWRLAKGIQDLDDTMKASNALTDADRQARVLAILDEITLAAGSVSAPGQNSNHKNLEENLNRLQMDIALARRAAEVTPPDYTAAEQLPVACLACHVGGPGGAQRR